MNAVIILGDLGLDMSISQDALQIAAHPCDVSGRETVHMQAWEVQWRSPLFGRAKMGSATSSIPDAAAAIPLWDLGRGQEYLTKYFTDS